MEDSWLNVVLIAKKNKSLNFLKALNSILNQIYTQIKVLIVDANEPNSMYSLGLQEDLVAFPKVEYLQMNQSFSVAGIRNIILSQVDGKYISFLSSDDIWDSTKALLQLEQLRDNPEAAASCCNGMLIDERKSNVVVEPLIEHLTFDTLKWLLNNPAKMSSQVIYRTEALREAGGFDERFVNFCDGDVLLSLSKKYKVLILPVSLCECYITPDYENYDWNNFKDYQRILYKYMEIFLANKPLTLAFYVRMLHLAKINYMWLNCFAYIFLYFIKAPGSSVLKLFTKTCRLFYYLFQWLHRESSLALEGIRISREIRRLQKGKAEKVKPRKPVLITEKTEDKLVAFSSARQYNSLNVLDFVFDHNLKSIVIPEYVTVIRKDMFYGCDQLTSIEIPGTVLEIQAHAFQNCKNLRQVTIQNGSRLGKIGPYAFSGCSALETISLPSSIVSIGKYAFFKCSSLKQLLFTYMHRGEEKKGSVFPSTMVKLPRYAFAGCSNLLTVEFGANSMLEFVEKGAFLGCCRLQIIVMTGSVKSLGSFAFAYCKLLAQAAFVQVDAIKRIGKCAFLYCEALTYFQIPNQIDRINMRTFYGCSSLKMVKIPKKVLSINHQAFAKCSSLTDALILTGDTTISPTAFEKHTQVQILEEVEMKKSYDK